MENSETKNNLEENKPMVELPLNHFALHKDYVMVRDFRILNRQVLNEEISNAEDFIAFVKEYSTEATKVFYNTNKIIAIFNYPFKEMADYADSKAILNLTETSEFIQFKAAIKNSFKQSGFIMFLKQCEPYISNIDTVGIIGLIEDLTSIKKINSVNKNVRKNISIDCEIKSGKQNSVEVPTRITIELPMFKAVRQRLTSFELELFYDAEDGFIITPKCWLFDKVVEDETRFIVKDIVSQLSLPSYFI